MKKLIFMLTLLVSNVSFAVEYDSEYSKMILENFPEGQCLKADVLGMQIVKTIDEGHYITVMLAGNKVVSHGVLETTKTKFLSPGRATIVAKYVGAKDLPLENGFTAKFGMWQECK